MRCHAMLLAAVSLLAVAGLSHAQIPPADLGELTLFSARDFVSVAGFAEYVGQKVRTEVVRAGKVVGAAWNEVEAGDHAYEINHPGGQCWGGNIQSPSPSQNIPQSLQVTPDVKPFDVVQIVDSNGLVIAGFAVADANVTSTQKVDDVTYVVKGYVGPSVNREFLEQRIINPEWKDGALGRRDARSLPGGIVTADKGGYQSGMRFEGNLFISTFVFDFPEDCDKAVGGQARIMSWLDQDVDGNRLGLTIYEDGEGGGPGLGGCPNSPGAVEAPQGSFTAQRNADTGIVTFDWNVPETTPDSSPLAGYYLSAMGPASAAPEKTMSEVGKRIMNPATTMATLATTGNGPFTYEMRSITENNAFSKPFEALKSRPSTVPSDAVPPKKISAQPDGNLVSFNNPENLDIYYTISDAEDKNKADIGGDTVSPTATRYTVPFNIGITKGERWVHWIAFNTANLETSGSQLISVEGVPKIEIAPKALAPTIGQKTLTARWESSDPKVASFLVQLSTNPAFSPSSTVVEATAVKAARSHTFSGLTAGTRYYVRVAGRNQLDEAGEKWSDVLSGIPEAETDRITITGGRYRAGKEMRVDGTASTNRNPNGSAATVRLYRSLPASSGVGPDMTKPVGGNIAIAGVAPSFTWSIRFRDNQVPANPNPIWAVSTGGGKAGPFTLGARRLARKAL